MLGGSASVDPLHALDGFGARGLAVRRCAASFPGRAGEGLHFQNVVRGRDGAILSVEVCLRVPRVEARSRVSPNYAVGFDDLIAFFRQLAAGWRGMGRRANL